MKIQRGFTLVEVAVVTSLIVILLGFITINLSRSQQSASLNSTQQILITDLRQQQLKAMTGDTEGRATSDTYGIHFDQASYTLFHGTYLTTETTNSVTSLPSGMQFNNSGYDIIFQKVSGEITSAKIIELKDNRSSKLRKIHVNIFGVVAEVELL